MPTSFRPRNTANGCTPSARTVTPRPAKNMNRTASAVSNASRTGASCPTLRARKTTSADKAAYAGTAVARRPVRTMRSAACSRRASTVPVRRPAAAAIGSASTCSSTRAPTATRAPAACAAPRTSTATCGHRRSATAVGASSPAARTTPSAAPPSVHTGRSSAAEHTGGQPRRAP